MRIVERVRESWGEQHTGFAYFNNDGNGCALCDASLCAEAHAKDGVDAGRIPIVGAGVTEG